MAPAPTRPAGSRPSRRRLTIPAWRHERGRRALRPCDAGHGHQHGQASGKKEPRGHLIDPEAARVTGAYPAWSATRRRPGWSAARAGCPSGRARCGGCRASHSVDACRMGPGPPCAAGPTSATTEGQQAGAGHACAAQVVGGTAACPTSQTLRFGRRACSSAPWCCAARRRSTTREDPRPPASPSQPNLHERGGHAQPRHPRVPRRGLPSLACSMRCMQHT